MKDFLYGFYLILFFILIPGFLPGLIELIL